MNDLQQIYQELILEEANSPKNFGKLKKPDLTGGEGNISCGDNITVQIKLSSDKKTIKDIKWGGEGCVITRASASVTTELVKGMTSKEVLRLNQQDILAKLGLEEISPGRLRCLMLALEVIKKSFS